MELSLLCGAAGFCSSTSAVERTDLNRLDVQTNSEEFAGRWLCYSILLFIWVDMVGGSCASFNSHHMKNRPKEFCDELYSVLHQNRVRYLIGSDPIIDNLGGVESWCNFSHGNCTFEFAL